MACQGCGRTSQNRMCCPTCIEYGRTSFFCSQECFTKNWKSHGQLHELLKKKKALAGNATAADASADIEGGGSTSQPRPKPPPGPTEDMPSTSTASSTRRNLAPLPGGTSLVSSFNSAAAEKRGTNGASSAVKRRPDGGAQTQGALPGVVGNVVGRLGAIVSSAFQGGASASDGTKDPTAAAGTRQRIASGANNAVAQSPRTKQGGKPGPWWSTFTRRFFLNGLLWGLALATILASAMFYREHLRYADAQAADQAVLDVPDIKTGATKEVRAPAEETPQAPEAPVAASSVASPLLAGLGLGGASPAASTNAAPSGVANSGASQESSLRAEVVALREVVERHDKMLRYIMDRYVEKSLSEKAASPAAKSSAAHEVFPESVSKSYDDVPASFPMKVLAGDGHRKRRGRDEMPMGEPEAESEQNTPAASSVSQDASSASTGTVAMPDRGKMQDSSQNQLGI